VEQVAAGAAGPLAASGDGAATAATTSSAAPAQTGGDAQASQGTGAASARIAGRRETGSTPNRPLRQRPTSIEEA